MAEKKRSRSGRRGKGKGKGSGAAASHSASRPPASAEDLDGPTAAAVAAAGGGGRVPKKRRMSSGGSRASSPVPPSPRTGGNDSLAPASAGASEPPPFPNNKVGEIKEGPDDSEPVESELPLVLTSAARRGVYECDYCRTDVTQVPRVRCAVCPDFDLCLDCLATTDPSAAGTIRAAAVATARLEASAVAAAVSSGDAGGEKRHGEDGGKRKEKGNDDGMSKTSGVKRSSVAGLSSAALNHDHTHGYRVADSTRFPVFPTVRGVTVIAMEKVAEASEETKGGEGKVAAEDELAEERSEKKASEDKQEVEEGDSAAKSETDDAEKKASADKGSVKDKKTCDVDMTDKEKKYEDESNKKEEGKKNDERGKNDVGAKDAVAKSEAKKEGEKKTEVEDIDETETKSYEARKETDAPNGKEDRKWKDAESADESKAGGVATGEGKREAGAEAAETKTVTATASPKLLWTDEPKAVWTAEEDLRLLDAISRYGLGNWADVADVVNGAADGSSGGGGSGGGTAGTGGTPIPGTSQKSARRCMERYCDDWLGRYGEIFPKYTLEEEPDEESSEEVVMEDGMEGAGTDKGDENGRDWKPPSSSVSAFKEEDTDVSDAAATESSGALASSGRKRKRKVGSFGSFSEVAPSIGGRRSPIPLSRQASSVMSSSGGGKAGDGFRSTKKYVAVETSSLPGYSEAWPFPYLPPLDGVKVGNEVNRDLTSRAEADFLKASNQSGGSKADFEAMRKEWQEKRLSEYVDEGVLPRAVLPPRLEDVRSLPGGELAGYMPRRGDFDVEWDNDAERILADMEFSAQDAVADRQLKIRIIESYNAKLDERERRKKFLLDRNLIDYRENQRKDMLLPPDERDLVNRMRLFARFHSHEEHDAFVSDLLEAKRLRKEIAKLQSYRRMGITSLAEAERYELDKARREQHRYAVKQKEAEERRAGIAPSGVSAAKSDVGAGVGPSSDSPALWRKYKNNDRRDRAKGTEETSGVAGGSEEKKKEGGEEATPPTDDGEEKKEDDFDVASMPGHELLSPKEKGLCRRLRLHPQNYLDTKKALIAESLRAGLLDNDEASKRTILKIDVEKRGDVIDFVARSGWISAAQPEGLPEGTKAAAAASSPGKGEDRGKAIDSAVMTPAVSGAEAPASS